MIRFIAVLLFACSASAHANEAPNCGVYTYMAEIVRVVDGDTIVADIDLGFQTWRRGEHLRLLGIDTPERGTSGFDASSNALRERIEGRSVYICTVKMKRKDREARGSFGRYLVTVYAEAENINEWMVSQGYAVRID